MHLFPFKHDHQLTEYKFINCCKDCERSYRLVKEQLDNFYQQIKDYTREDLRRLTQSEIYQLYLVLDDIAHFECGTHLADQIIQIICGDHFSLPLEEETQFFMVAAMTRPKREIFAHFAQVLPAGRLISFRVYEKGLRKILDQEEDIVLPEGFTAHCRICPHPPVNNTVIMIKKSFSDKTDRMDRIP